MTSSPTTRGAAAYERDRDTPAIGLCTPGRSWTSCTTVLALRRTISVSTRWSSRNGSAPASRISSAQSASPPIWTR